MRLIKTFLRPHFQGNLGSLTPPIQPAVQPPPPDDLDRRPTKPSQL